MTESSTTMGLSSNVTPLFEDEPHLSASSSGSGQAGLRAHRPSDRVHLQRT